MSEREAEREVARTVTRAAEDVPVDGIPAHAVPEPLLPAHDALQPDEPAAHVPDPHGVQSLAPKVVLLWRVGLLLQAILPSLLLGGGSWLVTRGDPWWPVGAAASIPWLLCTLLAWRLPTRRYATWRYRVEPDALRLDRGVMFRIESVVPFTRIQHVDTEQGPVERFLGLTRVSIHTAAGTGESLSIPGLLPGDAAALREQLAMLAGVVEPL